MAYNDYIENYNMAVRQSRGLKTKLPVTLSGSSATLDVGGTSRLRGVTTFDVPPVVTSGATRPVTFSALVGATVVLTAADSGGVFINRSTSGSPSWTLPTNVAGLYYTFVVSSTSAGFTVTGGTVFARANPNGASVTGTTLTNTQGTAVIGDSITLFADGTSWRSYAQLGIFAAA